MTDNIARLLALAAIGGSGSSGALVPEVVDALPTAGEEGKLYLVPRQVTETKNVFDEYIWTNDDWEKIGTTDIDLSNYLAKNNTTAYTPSGDYNPATKKYVDDSKLPVFEGTSGEWDNLTEAQKEEYYISLVEPIVDKIWYDTTNFRGYKFTFGAPIANPDFDNENNYFVFNFDDSYITISNLTNLGPIIKTDSHGQGQDAYVYVTSSTLNAVKEKWSNWYDWDNAEMDKWYHLDYTKQQGDPDLVVKMEGDFTIEAGFEYPQYTSINGMVNGQEWVPGWISEDPTVIYWDITPFLWMFKNIEEVELGGGE